MKYPSDFSNGGEISRNISLKFYEESTHLLMLLSELNLVIIVKNCFVINAIIFFYFLTAS